MKGKQARQMSNILCLTVLFTFPSWWAVWIVDSIAASHFDTISRSYLNVAYSSVWWHDIVICTGFHTAAYTINHGNNSWILTRVRVFISPFALLSTSFFTTTCNFQAYLQAISATYRHFFLLIKLHYPVLPRTYSQNTLQLPKWSVFLPLLFWPLPPSR